jgi:hypothetical protein
LQSNSFIELRVILSGCKFSGSYSGTKFSERRQVLAGRYLHLDEQRRQHRPSVRNVLPLLFIEWTVVHSYACYSPADAGLSHVERLAVGQFSAVLRMPCGETVYDYVWYPLMSSAGIFLSLSLSLSGARTLSLSLSRTRSCHERLPNDSARSSDALMGRLHRPRTALIRYTYTHASRAQDTTFFSVLLESRL